MYSNYGIVLLTIFFMVLHVSHEVSSSMRSAYVNSLRVRGPAQINLTWLPRWMD